MNISFKCKKIKLNTKKYGNIDVFIDRKNKIGNGYIVDTMIGKKYISGYIDLDFNEIIELNEKRFVDYFGNQNNEDICLKYKVKGEKNLECYHITKKEKSSKITYITGPYSEKTYNIINTSNPNYWLFETVSGDSMYAVYDIKKKKLITSFFDLIEFVEPDDSIYHTIFYQKTIKSDMIDEETGYTDTIIHTSLCGFLASDGSFSSDILDQEEEIYYPVFDKGINTFSSEYNNFITNIHKAYLEEYLEKSERINDYISHLAENPNIYNNSCKRQAKIISFNDRK